MLYIQVIIVLSCIYMYLPSFIYLSSTCFFDYGASFFSLSLKRPRRMDSSTTDLFFVIVLEAKTRLIAKFHKTNSAAWCPSGNEEAQFYNRTTMVFADISLKF